MAGGKEGSTETQIALLVQSVESMNESNKEGHAILFTKIDCLAEAVKGDGKKPGMLTRMALAEQSIGRIWWWLGSISLAILVAAVFVIRSSLV